MKRSDLEQQLLSQIIGAGLPAPHCEHRFSPPRRWRADFAFLRERILVEVEGGSWVFGRHQRGAGFEADCDKYNQAAISGWLLLRVTGAMVKDGRALVAIHQAFAVRQPHWLDSPQEVTNFLSGWGESRYPDAPDNAETD